VRIITLILTVATLFASPSLAANYDDFEAFIQSREVVATLYFNTNSEELSKSERERLIASVQQMRLAQKNGRMLRVEGFSSTQGNQEKNFILSFFRARSVADIIKAEGLGSEIALTGYGDLMAESKEHNKERRVEIASYVKPVAMKRVKVANGNSTPAILSNNSTQLKNDSQNIDSYRVDQAIRSKVEDKDGFAEQWDKLDSTLLPGLSQSELLKKEVERVYSLWRQSVAPGKSKKVAQAPSNDLQRSFTRYIRAISPTNPAGLTRSEQADDELKRGYSQVKDAATTETSPGLTRSEQADDELKRGYSQVREAADLDGAPGVTMVLPQAPVIDALMIEHAIMEKIGGEPTEPSGSVTQVGPEYQQ
jgi:hypothetical protein